MDHMRQRTRRERIADAWIDAWLVEQQRILLADLHDEAALAVRIAQARLRAVEEGLPILRATTTGISAVIDARGVVRQHLPLNRAGRIDGTIPPAAPPTLFARLGNILPLGWALLVLLLARVAMRKRAR